MTTFLEPTRLGELALQTTLWLTLGLGLACFLRGQPRLRKRLLALTLLGLLLLSALLLLPAPAWRLADLWPKAPRAQSEPAVAAAEVQVVVGASRATGEGLRWLRQLVSGSPGAAAFSPAGPEVAATGPRLTACLLGAAAALTGFFLLRLLAGLWALGRFRAQGQPIADAALHSLLAELGEKLHVKRRPALAEHPHLASPATLGWRRPLLLLPPFWRSWTEEERRCVLAHELAHVAAGDFSLSCFAHLARALHAWQPFAHLLTKQLLNQLELLADQAAARAVGGTDAYARALCRLALRPTRPVPQPPALAFWPASLSLSWRMTMLTKRNKEDVRPPGWPVRLLLGGLLALCLAAIAGLRGPAWAQEPGGETRKELSPEAKKIVLRQLAPQAAPPMEPFDLRFAQPGSLGVMVCRPALMTEMPSIRSYVPLIQGGFQQTLTVAFGHPLPSLSLAMIEQAGGSLAGKAKTGLDMGHVNMSLDFVRLAPAHSWAKLIAKDWPDLKTEKHAGKSYFRLDEMPKEMSGQFGWTSPAVGLVDDRTLVMGDEARVKQVLEGKHEAFKPVWSGEAQRQLDGCMAAVAIDLTAARRLADASGDKVQIEELRAFAPMWRQADSFLGGLLPGEPIGLKVIASAKPGQQLTMDWQFIESLKRAYLAILPAVTPNAPRLEQFPGYRQSGAAGLGTALVASELVIEARSAKTLAEFMGPHQTDVAPPLSDSPATYEADIAIYETPQADFEKLELGKRLAGEMKEPVAVPGQDGKAFFAGSGYRELSADQAAALKDQLAKSKAVNLVSSPKLRVVEGGLACVNYGVPAPQAAGTKPAEANPAVRQTLLTLQMNPAPENRITVAFSNWFDTSAVDDRDQGRLDNQPRPTHQPEVRRIGAVAEGGALLVVVPRVEKDGKTQMVVVTPRRVADAVGQFAFQLMLAEIDDAALERLKPYFTPLTDPVGGEHPGALYARKQGEFPALLKELTEEGQARVLARTQVVTEPGRAADVVIEHAASKTEPAPAPQTGPSFTSRMRVVPIKPLHYGVQFAYEAELHVGPGSKPQALKPGVMNGPYGEMQAHLARRADGKGWWLLAATPQRLAADAVPAMPPLMAKPNP